MAISKSVFLSDSRFPGCRSGTFQTRNFSEDGRRLVLQRRLQRCVVYVGHLAGLVFEVEVAQVFVDGIFAFAQITGSCLLRAKKKSSRQIENVKQRRDSEHQAADEPDHRSVSLRAFSRNSSSSAPRTGRRPSAMAGAGRFFQERITRTTMLSPSASATKGTIHAVRSKPVLVGAASTVGPYFCTKDCSTRLSLSPRPMAAISSLRMPSESGQPTWLH